MRTLTAVAASIHLMTTDRSRTNDHHQPCQTSTNTSTVEMLHQELKPQEVPILTAAASDSVGLEGREAGAVTTTPHKTPPIQTRSLQTSSWHVTQPTSVPDTRQPFGSHSIEFVPDPIPNRRSPTDDTHEHPTTPNGEVTQSSQGEAISEEEAEEGGFTPFLIDPATFAQQDIFDLATFQHLAAETAAEYHRRPLKSFPPIKRTVSTTNLAHHNPLAVRPPTGPEIPAPDSTRSSQSDDDREFQRLVREMHQEEINQFIRNDPALYHYQQQIEAYRRERKKLQQMCEFKLGKLEQELDQLANRNDRLTKLTQKARGIKLSPSHSQEHSITSTTSSYYSSPSTPTRRSSISSSSTSSSIGSAPSSRQSSPAPNSPLSFEHHRP